MFKYEGCGLDNVWLRNGYRKHKTPYGSGVSIDDVEGLHSAIAMALVTGKSRLDGDEIRFIRNQLDLSQKNLAEILGTTEQTYARWEKGQTGISGPALNLLRVLVVEKEKKHPRITEMLNRIRELEQDDVRLEMRDAQGKWSGEVKAA